MRVISTLSRLKNSPAKTFFFFAALLYAIIIIEAKFNYESEKLRVTKNNEAYVQTAEQYVEGIFSKTDFMLIQICRQVEHTQLAGISMDSQLMVTLKTIDAEFKEIASIGIVNSTGMTIANSLFAEYGPNREIRVDDRTYFQEQKNNPSLGLYISEPIISRSAGIQVINLSRRYNNKNGDFGGVVFATIRLTDLTNFFGKVISGSNQLLSLYDTHRNLIARQPLPKPEMLGKYFAPSNGYSAAKAANEKSGSYVDFSPVDKLEWLFTYKTFDNLPFVVFVGQTKASVFSSFYRRLYLFLFMVTCLIISVGLVFSANLKQKALIEKHQAASISAAKMSSLGEMASGMAHEINNPLAIISGYSQRIQSSLEAMPETEEILKIRTMNQKTLDSTDRIAKIIKGLRNFSRDGENDPKEYIYLKSAIENVFSLSGERFNAKGIRVTCDLSVPLKVFCRPIQIEQIILNLLNNAFDAVAEQDDKWVHVKIEEGPRFAHVNVTDSGPGVPPEIQEKIMRPFFTTKEIGRGIGLGLSISRGIAEVHGGRLRYLAGSPHTTFVLDIPLDQK